eukprot:s105_g2.t1
MIYEAGCYGGKQRFRASRSFGLSVDFEILQTLESIAEQELICGAEEKLVLHLSASAETFQNGFWRGFTA